MKITKVSKAVIPLILAATMLVACGQSQQDENVYTSLHQIVDAVIEDEFVALADSPALPDNIPMPEPSGTKQEKNKYSVIDYSNTEDGYVMVKVIESSAERLKVQVKRETTYTYDIQVGDWVTLPLSDGNGSYKVSIFENISGTKYSNLLTASFDVMLVDDFAPFIRPNQYVNYADAPETIAKAEELTADCEDELEKVEVIYEFVVNHLKYDKNKAKTVKSGYLPDLDEVLAGTKGICFDYAALMTAMLRSTGIPCKLVVGYAGKAYHAWINVWTEETGWVDGTIFFDGTAWQRMDPTFISSGKKSQNAQKYVGDGNNYAPKYLY